MRRIIAVTPQCILLTGIAFALLGSACPVNALDTSKPLNTSKGLYIRKSGTRVYKDPAPPRSRVYSYRQKNGTVVRHYVRNYNTRPGRAHGRRGHIKSRAASQRHHRTTVKVRAQPRTTGRKARHTR